MDSSFNIAVIRHGAARHNQTAVYSSKTKSEGGIDEHLLPGQEKQAAEVAALLQARGFGSAHIWCSPLQRTKDTAELLQKAGLLGKVAIVKELRELDAGALEGMPVPEIEGLSTPEKWRAHADYAEKMGGGESFEDVIERVRPISDRLICLPAQSKIIIVTHGSPSRALIHNLVGKDLCLSQWEACFFSSSQISQGKNFLKNSEN